MNILILYFSSIMFFQTTHASSILTCQISEKNYKAVLELDEVGKGWLTVKPVQNGAHRCELAVKSFENYKKRGPIVSLIGLRRKQCLPVFQEKQEKDIFKKITLEILVMSSAQDERVGHVQWLRRGPMSRCTLTKYDKESLNRNFSKFEKGLWGHSQ